MGNLGEPKLKRTLAVGDIHGCHAALETLANFAEFSHDDRIVTLGDYVDRGPNTPQVIQWLFECERHFFVHANAYAELDFDEQPDFMLYWERVDDPPPHRSGRVMVCGHTPQRSGLPRSIGHAVCIDTNACRGGWLTGLDVSSGRCYQSNEGGQTRSFWLDEVPPI